MASVAAFCQPDVLGCYYSYKLLCAGQAAQRRLLYCSRVKLKLIWCLTLPLYSAAGKQNLTLPPESRNMLGYSTYLTTSILQQYLHLALFGSVSCWLKPRGQGGFFVYQPPSWVSSSFESFCLPELKWTRIMTTLKTMLTRLMKWTHIANSDWLLIVVVSRGGSLSEWKTFSIWLKLGWLECCDVVSLTFQLIGQPLDYM